MPRPVLARLFDRGRIGDDSGCCRLRVGERFDLALDLLRLLVPPWIETSLRRTSAGGLRSSLASPRLLRAATLAYSLA